MTREHKLALILGFSLVLVVGILVSDHLSGARRAMLEDPGNPEPVSAARHDLRPMLPGAAQASPARDEVYATAEPPAPQSAAGPDPVVRLGTLAYDPDAEKSLRDRIAEALQRSQMDLVPVAPAAQTDSAPVRGEPTPPPVERSPAPRRDVTLHNVVPGDTVWSIAEKHYGDGFLSKQLAVYNKDRLAAGGVLRVGATLLIPDRAVLLGGGAPSSGASAATTASAPVSTPASAEVRRYTVQRGDDLGTISSKTLGTAKRWREIYELNRDVIEDPDVVPAGVALRLPAR